MNSVHCRNRKFSFREHFLSFLLNPSSKTGGKNGSQNSSAAFFPLPLSLVNVNTEDFRLQVFLPSGVGATAVVKIQKSADNVPWKSAGSVSLRRRLRQRNENVAVLDYVRQRDLNVRRQHLVPATRCLHAPSGPHSSSTRSSSVSISVSFVFNFLL